MPPPSRCAASLRASPFADTAATAMVATVIAVPSAMTKVATIPAQNKPWASANTISKMAPEHGRMPTVSTAPRPRRQPPGPASSLGSGPCE